MRGEIELDRMEIPLKYKLAILGVSFGFILLVAILLVNSII